ncbi:MAG: hypothetical protein D6766_03460 [Verrucomicrobia bacterium]|nr:MAG: hypothetical protein D6766_03460 [Verrucomicrobiota bacterium]
MALTVCRRGGHLDGVERLPLVVHEDDDLLVIDKPAGWNTHAPNPWAGEGVYEWLRDREPRWASLAILHRLDQATSGLLVFGKTPRANRSLTRQFAEGRVRKRYLLLTDRPPLGEPRVIRQAIVRAGPRYQVAEPAAGGQPAETRFEPAGREGRWTRLAAEPRTGRTHQIRVHAAWAGFPILGDTLYGGSPFGRVCLHAAELAFRHPADDREVRFRSEPDFETPPHRARRRAIIDPAETDAFRLIHGEPDGWPEWQVDRLGGWLLAVSETDGPGAADLARLEELARAEKAAGVYHRRRERHVRERRPEEVRPEPVFGRAAEGPVWVRENGLRFRLDFGQGYSVGLFLDQRDNRRRWLTRHVAAGFGPLRPKAGAARLLNLFAYTCAFSVAAAAGGWETTSLDLSRGYLEWGRENFRANELDPAQHDFIYGDALDWLKRLARRGRRFEAVILDPPTFSTSKRGVFRAERDYPALVEAALGVLAPEGVLFASTNAGGLTPPAFVDRVTEAVRAAGRRVLASHYAPQPPDFPITPKSPPHLKSLWLRVG